MPFIRRDADGKLFGEDRDGQEHLLTPKLISSSETSVIGNESKEKVYRFKLATVRKLTKFTLDQVNNALASSAKNVESAALRTGQPTPYPAPIPTANTLNQYYGIFIDEDLNKQNTPFYTFSSPSTNIKCFVTANGTHVDDWSFHVAHLVDKKTNPDGSFTTKWRLFTYDNNLNLPGKLFYVLESESLPSCFSQNFDVSSLNYIGGGGWTGISIDKTDRLPILGLAPTDSEQYIPVGQARRILGQGSQLSIVSYSCTPTYTFTWCRGKLELNKRVRSASQTTDIGKLKSTGVITSTREHSYNLKIAYRPSLDDDIRDIKKVENAETLTGKAVYVGNTNLTVASQYQSPDFNTDVGRLSIQSYQVNTNIIRPNYTEYTKSVPLSRISFSPLCYIPIVCTSNNMALMLRYNMGNASGSINHGYEQKATAGTRGYQYGDDYKYWWGYGQVTGVTPVGDTHRYRTLKSTGQRIQIGSMFDLGDIHIDTDFPNRIITTWGGLANPQTGFFGYEDGTLSFIVNYINPPLIGHDGVYYYHINPPEIGAGAGAYERSYDGLTSNSGIGTVALYGLGSTADTPQGQQNDLMFTYSQILGALGGGGLSSINIGNVTIAENDKESIVVRSPDSTQQAAMQETPEIFPNGFFDSDVFSVKLNNANHGSFNFYDIQGNFKTSSSF